MPFLRVLRKGCGFSCLSAALFSPVSSDGGGVCSAAKAKAFQMSVKGARAVLVFIQTARVVKLDTSTPEKMFHLITT